MSRQDIPALFADVVDAPHDFQRWHALADALDEAGKPNFANLLRTVISKKNARDTWSRSGKELISLLGREDWWGGDKEQATLTVAGLSINFIRHTDFNCTEIVFDMPDGPLMAYVTDKVAKTIAAEADEEP